MEEGERRMLAMNRAQRRAAQRRLKGDERRRFERELERERAALASLDELYERTDFKDRVVRPAMRSASDGEPLPGMTPEDSAILVEYIAVDCLSYPHDETMARFLLHLGVTLARPQKAEATAEP